MKNSKNSPKTQRTEKSENTAHGSAKKDTNQHTVSRKTKNKK